MKKFLKKIRNKIFLNAVRNVCMKKLKKKTMGEDFHGVIQSAISRVMEIRDKDNFTCNFKSRKEFESFCFKHEKSFLHDSAIGNLAKVKYDKSVQNYKYRGFCSICSEEVDFICDSNGGTHIEGMLCPKCRQNVRLRMMYNAVLAAYRKGMKVYASECVTGFFQCLKNVIPDIIGSEFLEPDDDRRKTIRHEDITKLSFADESLDLYISNDVLEHVFDYKAAFREAHRVISNGGKFLFHAPFHYKNDKTEIRAKLDIQRGGYYS